MEAASGNTDVRSGAAFILDEVPDIPEIEKARSVTENPETEQTMEPETEEVAETEIQTVEEEQQESLIGTLIIADVNNYVNIRSIPGEDGEILGKLYDNSVGTLLEEPQDWLYIEYGSVQGYVKAEYVLTGEAARIRADEVGTRLAEVTTTTLKVREEATTESIVLGLVPGGDILSVQEEVDGWVKVSIEEGDGYVSTDYLNVYTENVKAESAEEERIRLEKEAERKKAEEAARKAIQEKEAAKKEAEKKEADKKAQASSTPKKDTASQNTSSQNSSSSQTTTQTESTSSDADLGQQIASYGMQFIGNPYVYGGTSLTNGTDCLGFVMSVYAHFGISLPRTSGEQGKSEKSVDGLDNARAGDLVWYSGHIAIYTGNGKVVHASNKKEGIKTSNADYRTILGIRRIV